MVIGFFLKFGVIVIVIFELMSRMVVVVKTARCVIMGFLILRMDVREAMNMFVRVFVRMVVLNLSMPVPVHMQVMV
jgi:hypothetical protein